MYFSFKNQKSMVILYYILKIIT